MPCYRVDKANPELQQDLSILPKGSFVWTKGACSDSSNHQFLSDLNFRVVDVNVLFERSPTIANYSNSNFEIRSARKDEVDQVASLAEKAFRYSRFHLDLAFDSEIGSRVKRAWIESFFEGKRGDDLHVCVMDSSIVGFNLIFSPDADSRIIDLIAVDESVRGKGIASKLICYLQGTAPQSLIRVGTQAANIPSMRLYEGLGFKVIESKYVYHYHS